MPLSRSLVACQVFAMDLALEAQDAEVHNAVVKSYFQGARRLQWPLPQRCHLNGWQRHIEGASSHVVAQDIALSIALLVSTYVITTTASSLICASL